MEIGQGNLKFFNLEVTEYMHCTGLSYHLSVSIQEKKMARWFLVLRRLSKLKDQIHQSQNKKMDLHDCVFLTKKLFLQVIIELKFITNSQKLPCSLAINLKIRSILTLRSLVLL